MPRPGSASSGRTTREQQQQDHHQQQTPASPTLVEPAPETMHPPRPKSKRAKKRARTRNRRAEAFPQEPDHPSEPRHLSHGADIYHHRNLSDASIESASLLDHRGQPYTMRARRPSAAIGEGGSGSNLRFTAGASSSKVKGIGRQQDGGDGDDYSSASSDSQPEDGENSPLLAKARDRDQPKFTVSSPGGTGSKMRSTSNIFSTAERSANRPISSSSGLGQLVNFPPSVPGSPSPGHSSGLGYSNGVYGSFNLGPNLGDTLIDMGGISDNEQDPSPSPGGGRPHHMVRRNTSVEEDVCFPVDEPMLDEDTSTIHEGSDSQQQTRPRSRGWPDLSVLDEWATQEKEQRSEGIRQRRMEDPVYVGGRLRPRGTWHREEDDMPYRFTYFNEEFASTIHSHTISELLQPGQTFEELFRPEPRVETPQEEYDYGAISPGSHATGDRKGSKVSVGTHLNGALGSEQLSEEAFQQQQRLDQTSFAGETATQRPTFWLDVLSPTDQEMKVLSRAFGIHPLTIEDILLQEAREKVELFRNYYLVAYKTFEQDPSSENYLEPINVYAVVFREGILTFHFSLIPHCANVRRRVRQLKDYISVSADWISYALIDDITDAFAPLISSIETEAEILDHSILQLHTTPLGSSGSSLKGEKSGSGPEEVDVGDILRQIGDCRKKVMGLYRLLGNKADVIKGFSKRCNERWSMAPRSEIGLYLGDIQDHIVTMVSNLSHYEKILSRAFSNYLAQINLKMNERAEQTADVLGRLTVLGTIVLPMNIITGLWGMNVLVPGQNKEGLSWFFGITGCLMAFGFMCYFIAKRVYGIV